MHSGYSHALVSICLMMSSGGNCNTLCFLTLGPDMPTCSLSHTPTNAIMLMMVMCANSIVVQHRMHYCPVVTANDGQTALNSTRSCNKHSIALFARSL